MNKETQAEIRYIVMAIHTSISYDTTIYQVYTHRFIHLLYQFALLFDNKYTDVIIDIRNKTGNSTCPFKKLIHQSILNM